MNANTSTADYLTGCPLCVFAGVWRYLTKHGLGNLIFYNNSKSLATCVTLWHIASIPLQN